MTASALVTFREFPDPASLEEYAELLRGNDIPFAVEDTKPRFDVTFANNDTRRVYKIMLLPEYLEAARSLASEADKALIGGLPEDYYLFGFSEDELREVMLKVDEWNPFDVMLAELLLAERGAHVDRAKLEAERTERVEVLDEPESARWWTILLGYFTSLFSVLGLMIAITLITAKKVNARGEKVRRYRYSTQIHGCIMLVELVISTCLTVWVALNH